MDLISVDPIFNLYNREWPILTWQRAAAAGEVRVRRREADGPRARLDGLRRRRGLGRRGAALGALPERPRPLVRRGRGLRAHARASRSAARAVVRRRSSTRTCVVAPDAQVGVDPEADRERFTVSDGGIVVVPQGRRRGGVACSVALLTREYPPEVYGGAGVHVEYLGRELARLVDLTVHCWGGDARRRPASSRTAPGTRSAATRRTSPRCRRCRSTSRWPRASRARSVVHSHTWYANLAGHLGEARPRHPARRDRALARAAAAVEGRAARRRLRALELLRADRAGGRRRGDRRSEGMRRRHPRRATRRSTRERVRVIYNGIDADEYAPDAGTDVLERLGVDPTGPSVRLRRADHAAEGRAVPARRGAGVRRRRRSSCSARARPTRRRSAPRSSARVERLRAERGNVIWIDELLPKPDVIQLLSHATVFACPSIYEPLGIVNLEAMACEAAVVATATGGIVEVVRRRRDGAARPVRAGAGRHRAASTRAAFSRGDRRARQRAAGRPGAGGGDGSRGARAGGRVLRLGRDRGADRRRVSRRRG